MIGAGMTGVPSCYDKSPFIGLFPVQVRGGFFAWPPIETPLRGAGLGRTIVIERGRQAGLHLPGALVFHRWYWVPLNKATTRAAGIYIPWGAYWF